MNVFLLHRWRVLHIYNTEDKPKLNTSRKWSFWFSLPGVVVGGRVVGVVGGSGGRVVGVVGGAVVGGSALHPSLKQHVTWQIPSWKLLVAFKPSHMLCELKQSDTGRHTFTVSSWSVTVLTALNVEQAKFSSHSSDSSVLAQSSVQVKQFNRIGPVKK